MFSVGGLGGRQGILGAAEVVVALEEFVAVGFRPELRSECDVIVDVHSI